MARADAEKMRKGLMEVSPIGTSFNVGGLDSPFDSEKFSDNPLNDEEVRSYEKFIADRKEVEQK